MANKPDSAEILTQAFDRVLTNEFGSSVPPPPLLTPFGVRTFDALLGGGITSSSPVGFSSTPETGKSTIALQIAASFQAYYPNSTVVYLNTEDPAAGKKALIGGSTLTVLAHNIDERIESFGINKSKFLHKPIELNIPQVFQMLQKFAEIKRQVEEKTGKEHFILVIWDSIAATPSSKDETADDPDSVIGYKGRELTFSLSKYKKFISMFRMTFIVIDQVRANMQIKSRFQVSDEKTVGTWSNVKAATAISSLHHLLRQWVFLSKGTQLSAGTPKQVDGWILNVLTEKNKLAPSQYTISLVFDKKWGVIPFWSEFLFMEEMTKTEVKLTNKNESKLIIPLALGTSGNSKLLRVIDPTSGNKLYEKKFMERNAIQLYNSDNEFRHFFDMAVDISVEYRIKQALFRDQPTVAQVTQDEAVQSELAPHLDDTASAFDVEVGDGNDMDQETYVDGDSNAFNFEGPPVITPDAYINNGDEFEQE